MKGFDAFAGVIKSGGKTRRAAKMVILNSTTRYEKFIWCKARKRRKPTLSSTPDTIRPLDGDATVPSSSRTPTTPSAYGRVHAGRRGRREYWTRSVGGGNPVKRYKARDLMRQIAEATHQCGDPGMQSTPTVNRCIPARTRRESMRRILLGVHFLDDSAQPGVDEPGEVRRAGRAVRC